MCARTRVCVCSYRYVQSIPLLSAKEYIVEIDMWRINDRKMKQQTTFILTDSDFLSITSNIQLQSQF